MNSTIAAAWAGVAVAIFGMAAGLFRVFMVTGRLAFQVETMWDFHVRRGKVEAVKAGWGYVSSPFHISAAGFEAALPFLTKFLPFYASLLKIKPPLPEREMMLRFEAEFGDYIMEQVCIPAGVSQGACLIAIMAACDVSLHETPPVAPPAAVATLPVTKEG